MTDHWKDVTWFIEHDADGDLEVWLDKCQVDAARAKDAEAHAAALAAKDAEIVRLRAQIDEDAHLRSVVELYRSDPIAMADALVRMREALGAAREQLEQRPA